jgi:hypothetical protein
MAERVSAEQAVGFVNTMLSTTDRQEQINASGWVVQFITQNAALSAEVERLREDARWRPIESAPKDGTPILVYLAADLGGSRFHTARLHPNVSVVGGVFAFDAPRMTRWKPLEPPAQDAGAVGGEG